MPRVKKGIQNYLRTLIQEAVKNSQEEGLTSKEITNNIRSRLESDVRNRINAILAIGTEMGAVCKDENNRYVVSQGIVEMDAALDACCKPRFYPSARFCTSLRCRQRCCSPLMACCVPRRCCAPLCCKIVKKCHFRKRHHSGYKEELQENCCSGSEG